MGELLALIEKAQNGMDVQKRLYGRFPIHIAGECGAAEVLDITQMLDRLELDRAAIEPWNGDAQDDIGRIQMGLAALLSCLVKRFPSEASVALLSKTSTTRFWGAWALERSPCREVVPALRQALATERDTHVAQRMKAALRRCNGWLTWLGLR